LISPDQGYVPGGNSGADEDESSDREAPITISADMLAHEAPRPLAGATDGRVDFEKQMSRVPPVTLTLIGACMAAFAVELGLGSLSSRQAILAAGALQRDLVLQGQVWRLASSMFLHGSLGHLFGNCVALYILGVACEHAYGRRRVVLLYFAAGVFGGLLSIQLGVKPSVGASGAIFGLQAAAVVFFYKYHRYFYLRDKRIGLVLLVWGLYTIGTGFLTPFVDNFAHLGGAATGAAAAMLLKPRLVAAADTA